MSFRLRDVAGAFDAKAGIATAAVLSVAASLAALTVPWLVGEGVADLFGDTSTELHTTLGLIVGLLTLRLALEFASTLLAGKSRYQFISELRSHWYDRVLRIPPGAEGDSRRQEWVSVLSYDIPRVAEVLVDMPIALVQAAVTLIGAAAVMSIINAPLTANVSASKPIAQAAPIVAARMPPTAAPNPIAVLLAIESSALAAWRSCRSTTSGTSPTLAGQWSANAVPITAASPISAGTVAEPVNSSTAIAACDVAASTSAQTIMRWREPRSASAPPKSWKSSCAVVADAMT